MARAEADRRPLLAKLHIARKDLALTEDSYRDVLRRVTGQDSAAALGLPQMEAALAEFRRLGWKPKQRLAARRSGKAQVRMIHAVWAEMAPLLDDGSAEALRAFTRRQTKGPLHPDGVSAPEFLDATGANKVLEGLKAWRRRLQVQARAAAP